jgi:hypothetical protein
MAMNGDTLGQEWAQLIAGLSSVPPDPDQMANLETLYKAMAGILVSHIQENAEVPAGIAVKTAGSASAQEGATTGVGKIK